MSQKPNKVTARRRQRRNRWFIAHAALAGAVILRVDIVDFVTSVPMRRWTVHYPDGQQSHHYKSRGEASAHYLVWWFDKQGMFPPRAR